MLPADLTPLALGSGFSAAPYCGIVVTSMEGSHTSPPPGLPSRGQVVHRGRRLTAEQIKRCDIVEIYHELYHHPSDASLSEILDTGKAVPSTFLTGADVRNNRFLRGAAQAQDGGHPGVCLSCDDSRPADPPNECISYDSVTLRVCDAPDALVNAEGVWYQLLPKRSLFV